MAYKNFKVVYRRYASLYFIVGIDSEEVTEGFNMYCTTRYKCSVLHNTHKKPDFMVEEGGRC